MHKQKLTQLELRKLYGHKKNDKKWWKWYRGSLRGQRHLPSKNYPKYLPPPAPAGLDVEYEVADYMPCVFPSRLCSA